MAPCPAPDRNLKINGVLCALLDGKKHANDNSHVIYGEGLVKADDYYVAPTFAMLKLTYDTDGAISEMSYKLHGVENNEMKDIPLTLDCVY